MSEPDELLATADAALSKAARRADEAEVVIRHDESASTTIRGALSSGRAASRTLVGVRLRVGRRVGAASAALVDEATLARLVEQAREAALLAPETAGEGAFARGERLVAPAFRKTAPPLGATDARERAQAIAAELTGAEYATVATGGVRTRVVVATSGGTFAADASEACTATIEARVNERLPRAVTSQRMGRAALDVNGFGASIVADLRTAQRIGALPDGQVPVILDADTSSKLMPNVAVHLNAAIARHGLSRFSGRLEQRVFAETVTLRDAAEGTRLGGRARTLDDEGVRTRARDVVRRGVLVDLVHNAEEARLAGRADAAGNGYRGRDIVDAPPRPAFTQMELAPGRAALPDLAREADRAILVRHELLGWYHSTGVGGLLSVVAPCAFLVEKGEVVSGLPPVTLGFDALQVLADEALLVGESAAVTPHGTSAPLLLRNVAVSA